ncbi:MAG TPA: asparagine--tRNA ligase [Candidatus Polarisedimenticolia bacterium]|nr:asparagine--tRNA ligase [Candidatus Polarisedimenticolia bacterium]
MSSGPVAISDLEGHVGGQVTLRGWVYHKRDIGKIRFLVMRDGSGYAQGVVVAREVAPEVFEAAGALTQESSFLMTGTVRREPRAPGGFEINVNGLSPIHVAAEYPISPKEHGTEFLMDNRHLWLRSSRPHAILRVRHEVCQAIREFFDQRGFVLIDAPIFTPAACEGTSTLFETEYFGDKAYLTQSGQLYLEPACMAFGKVYCFGPTFRAEKSKTRRHLTEFWMVEPEVAFLELPGLLDLAEEFILYIVGRVLDKRREELKVLERDISKLEAVSRPFPRMRYDEAAAVLKEKGVDFQHGNDFGGTDETILSEMNPSPLMVTHYPAAVKAFYMQPDTAAPDKALCVDILAPEGYGEIIGGSQRIHDYDVLHRRILEHGLPEEAFKWYLEIRKYGTVPHSGFGMGIERTVTWLCGIHHLREAIPYPRTLSRIYP